MRSKPSNSYLCLLAFQPEQKLSDLVASYFETENFVAKVLLVIESNEMARARQTLKDNTVRVEGRF